MNKPRQGAFRWSLPDRSAKAEERKGKKVPVSTLQERSIVERKHIPITLSKAPWEKLETT